MTYSTSTMIKQRMKISGTKRDTELTFAIVYADARCDAAISANGGSTPVASPHQILKEASADFAAYYIHRVDNPTVATLFLESAKTLLSNYINKELRQGGSGRSGKRGIHDV